MASRLPEVTMFERLIESSPRRTRSPRDIALSLALHVVLVLLATAATRGAAAITRDLSPASPFVLGVAPPSGPASVPRGAGAATTPAAAPRFPDLDIAGVDIPPAVTIPSVPDAGPHDRVPPRGLVPGLGAQWPLPEPNHRVVMVDEPVEPIAGPRPTYPVLLRQAGITGKVRLRFVVTARGEVDSTTIAVVQSTHPAFDTAAVRAILRWRYRPARIGADAVAQLVEQNVRFDLDREG